MGDGAGKERDPVGETGGKPVALVFVHAIERSMVPLLRVVDDYGAGRRDSIKTEFIFLTADKLEGERRVKAAANSLKLQSRVGLSVDGVEGPGNFGLNKECMITIVVAKGNAVAANYALVQPGIADASKVLKALAEVSGDLNPPTVEELTQRQNSRRPGGMRGGEAEMGRERAALDLAKLDLSSEAGLREAVKALMVEVRHLRAELAAARGGTGSGAAPEKAFERPKEPFPGAVPADAKLQAQLRSFIRPNNDDGTVDKVLAEVKEHIKNNEELRQQALDGWTRILHFGDRYGTAYARKVGQEFLGELQRAAQKK